MRRIALCIGNQDYKILPKLEYAIADAKAMEKVLKKLGFETMLGTNLNRTQLGEVIFEFGSCIDDYDAILVYYAGHGFQIENNNILAPIDLDIFARPEMVRYNAFPLQDLLTIMSKNPEQTKIIILDACRENLGVRGSFNTFAPISAPSGSIVAFSTSPGKYSKENNTIGHGIYTNALLQYIELPRVEIETVFKKVREKLTADTNGVQIPWEHTSLIGSFFFNPDTIYDGTSYLQEALADSGFKFSPGSEVKPVVDGLKSLNWPTQEQAIKKVNDINMSDASSNELFVLGRNIYQAANGNSFACQRFIDSFDSNNRIPDEAKVHVLNGMAFEIYYDSYGKLRTVMKAQYYRNIVYLLELPEFYASKEFISSHLCKIEERPIYIPGQQELMFLQVVLKCDLDTGVYELAEIRYQGKNILKWDEDEYTFVDHMRKRILEESIAKALVAPPDALRFQYNTDEIANESYIQLETGDFKLYF